MKTPTLSTNYIHRLLGRSAFLFLSILIGCFGLLPKAQAVSPAPDGGYPGGNTAEGQNALLSLTTGGFNTAVGFLSLRSNATGQLNTAIGAGTLLANTADGNTATGGGALFSNTSGPSNTATGAFALFGNTTGNNNNAFGFEALFSNTTGPFNNAFGNGALASNTTGDRNTAIGDGALLANTTGAQNVAVGVSALRHSNGFGNIAIGQDTCLNLTTGSGNTALGFAAGNGVTTAINVIAIGAEGANVSGSCFIGNIREVTTQIPNAVPVLIDGSGQLGTMSSSRRFKKGIKPMDKASEGILALKPVTFHYKSDATNRPEFGLIAEEVAEVNPDLVVRDGKGEIYTVRYDAVNAMLLNEFLKEHKAFLEEQRKAQEQQATITQLKKDFRATVAQLTTRLDEQAAQIQKVSAQLEAGKPAPQVVNNQ